MSTTTRNGEWPGRVRVLIADDDLGQRALLKLWIERHGAFDVAAEVADGLQAVEAARRLQPQVAVLDLAMPRMDGLEAAAELRRLFPDIRIVIRSGFTAERMAQKAIDSGADVYLEKATALGEFLAVLEELVPAPEAAGQDHGPSRELPGGTPRIEASYDDLLLDALDVGVLRVDGAGRIRSANFQATLALGVPTSRLVGSPVSDLLGRPRTRPDDDAGAHPEEGTVDPVSAALASGRPVSGLVVEVARSVEGPAWLSLSVRPARSPADGHVSGAVVVVRDVTEERRLREVVRDAHDRLPRVLEAIDVPLVVLRTARGEMSTATDFVVAHANRAARALTGWVAGARLHRDAVHTRDPSLRSIGEDEVVVSWHTRARADRVDAVRRAGAAATTELLEAAVVSSPVGSLLFDAAARLVIANPVADRLLAGTPLLGGHSHARILLSADTAQPVQEADLPVRAACAGKPFDDIELLVVDKDGAEKGTYVRISGRPVFAPGGEPAGAVISVWDETATKLAEQALQASRAELERSNAELANFASIASHDLSQPLQHVYGFAQLLQEGGLDEERAADYIDRIVAGGERMRALIEDLLTYSRLTSEARPFEPVDLADVVQEVLDLYEENIVSSGARVEVGSMPTVVADRVQMSQLFQNLVGNALTYVAEDISPVITMSADRTDGAWQLAVADNGIGIRPEDRESAFAMFRRLVPADDYPGTGIGLAVCARITERHGGRIWIEDNPGGGSIVCLTLPDSKGS